MKVFWTSCFFLPIRELYRGNKQLNKNTKTQVAGKGSNDLACFQTWVNRFLGPNQSTSPSPGLPFAFGLTSHNYNLSLKTTGNMLELREEMLMWPSAWTFTRIPPCSLFQEFRCSVNKRHLVHFSTAFTGSLVFPLRKIVLP